MIPDFKIHFDLSRQNFVQGIEQGRYNTSWGALNYIPLKPTEENFRPLFNRVGKPWGWHEMTDRFSEAAMADKLAQPETRLNLLRDGGRDVGYTLIVKPSDPSRFWPDDTDVIEIENVGLFPEECGKRRGWSFIEMQCANLFQRYNAMTLSCSSTNHPHIPAWYQRHGMRRLATDVKPQARAIA